MQIQDGVNTGLWSIQAYIMYVNELRFVGQLYYITVPSKLTKSKHDSIHPSNQ